MLSRVHQVYQLMKNQELLHLEMQRFCGRDGVWYTPNSNTGSQTVARAAIQTKPDIIALGFSWHHISEVVLANVCVAIGKRQVGKDSHWQQATIEITCHDHSIRACSCHIYMGVVRHRQSVRGESHIQRNANREAATSGVH